MVFTSPALYFRTSTTTSTIIPDPSNLPATQVLEFVTTGANIIEAIQQVSENNVSTDPSVNPDGRKKVSIQDNGRLNDVVTVSGKILNTNTVFINKLRSFKDRLQIEPAFHKFGIFGFAYPVTPAFSFDPTDLRGLVIKDLQLGTTGQKQNYVEFQLTLITGGEL